MVGVEPVGEAPIGLYTKLRKTRTFEMDVMQKILILKLLNSGVARAFPGGRLAHPESQNEEENEKSLRKNKKKNYLNGGGEWGKWKLLPTRDCEAGYGPAFKPWIYTNGCLNQYHSISATWATTNTTIGYCFIQGVSIYKNMIIYKWIDHKIRWGCYMIPFISIGPYCCFCYKSLKIMANLVS